MKKIYWLFALLVFGTTCMFAQQPDPISTGLGGVATVIGETRTANDSVAEVAAPMPVPLWKQKLYYGYNFDIYFHHDTRGGGKENGWSIALEPEIGWKLKERIYLGLRLGGSYQNTTFTADSVSLRVHQGSWSVTPYMRYRLKTMFNDKLGIWLEAHLYTGMEFPQVIGNASGTNYDGLKHSITYGLQVSPVITYKFNRKSTFQIFFSILSLGYSGTTFCYQDAETGARHNEYTNDVIIFSGKLRNLLANQFTPGLYGLKFGVQKSF